jgi:glycosyltransferase involved in cell wall biosynthesis
VVGRVAFAVPGDLATPTGGYAYDRRMIAELERLGWNIDVINLGEGFPRPSQEQCKAAQERLLAIAAGRPIVIDGLAFSVLPEVALQLCPSHRLIALVHHPLALESGLSATQAGEFRASERAALAAARRVVVTSATTARLLAADYGVPAEHIVVACPGTDSAPAAHGGTDGIVRLLAVGAVVQRKGFDVLIAALATLPDLPWRLTIAGDRGRDPEAVARLDGDIVRYKLSDRIAVLGAVSPERLAELYVGADLFTLASRFEGYGMAFSEALAHGLPVIGTTAGAIPETVPAGAGVLVAPDDAAAFAVTLRRAIENPVERRRMAECARTASQALPSWQDSARQFARALGAAE